MVPVEVQEDSLRFQGFVAEESNEGRRMNLDLQEEASDHARINSEALKRRVELSYNVRIDGLNKRGVNCLSNIFAKID